MRAKGISLPFTSATNIRLFFFYLLFLKKHLVYRKNLWGLEIGENILIIDSIPVIFVSYQV